ncbi:hypothetical protein OFL74_22205, partial [Pseudomonas aeruginosa]|nr:hypothetical protein [Pseudomonas aeruginosa]
MTRLAAGSRERVTPSATIRAEANLAGIPADLEKLAVRVIHAC